MNITSTKSKRLGKARNIIRARLAELKGRPIPAELRYAFSALSNDGEFNQMLVFSDMPRAPDHKLQKVTDIRTATVQNYSWGSPVSFPINNSSADFLCGSILEFTVSAPTAVSAYLPSAGDFFRDIILRMGTTKVLEVRKQVIHQYNLCNDDLLDYTRKAKLEEDMAVVGTKIDRGTGGTNVAVTYYLDLGPFICDRQWLPISKKLMNNEIYLDINIEPRERVIDTGGNAETATITSMRFHQTSYVDSQMYYIDMIKALMAEGLPILYPYRYFDTEDIAITATTTNYNLNFVNRSMVEQLLFHTLATASYTDLNFNPETDAEEVDEFRLEYQGQYFYPNRSGFENHKENTVLKRVVGWNHERNYYKLTFGDTTLEKKIGSSLSPATSNTTINLNYQVTKPQLVINTTIVGSHLIVTAVSKRMLKINKDGSVKVFES